MDVGIVLIKKLTVNMSVWNKRQTNCSCFYSMAIIHYVFICCGVEVCGWDVQQYFIRCT